MYRNSTPNDPISASIEDLPDYEAKFGADLEVVRWDETSTGRSVVWQRALTADRTEFEASISAPSITRHQLTEALGASGDESVVSQASEIADAVLQQLG